MEDNSNKYLPVPLKYTRPIIFKFTQFLYRKGRSNLSSFNYYYIPEIGKWVKGEHAFNEKLKQLNISYIDWENRWILNSVIGTEDWINKVIEYRYKDKPINTRGYIKSQLELDVNYKCDFFIVKEDLINNYKNSRIDKTVVVEFDFSLVPDKISKKSDMFILKYDGGKLYKTNYNKFIVECKDPKDYMIFKVREKRATGKDLFEKQGNLKYNNKYNYDKVVYINNRTNVIITCPIHGDFLQTPSEHLRNRESNCGCPKCSHDRMVVSESKYKSLDEVIKDAKQIHPEYDYSDCILENPSKVNINIYDKIRVFCPIHKEYFWQSIELHINRGCRCPKCSVYTGNAISFEEFKQRSTDLFGNRYRYDRVKTFEQGLNTIVELYDTRTNSVINKKANSHLHCATGNPRDHISKGEVLVESWLKDNNFDYISEDFVDIQDFSRGVFVDFTLKFNNVNIWIEYNGIQHYQFIDYFHKDIDNFHNRLLRDSIVRSYCRDNNIKLIEIPYTLSDKASIFNFLDDTINNNIDSKDLIDYKQLYKIDNYDSESKMLWPWT